MQFYAAATNAANALSKIKKTSLAEVFHYN